LALAAYVVPPLTSWLVLRFVVRPGLAWARAACERAQRAQVADQVRASLEKAKAEQALIAGASDRKRAIESSEDKQLLVRYSFKGVMHEVVADDREELVLPPQHAASQ
ncbi:domain of unknown function (DUF3395), partial [Haematococcus lacustris]